MRPKPTTHGNRDSWKFIPGKNAAPKNSTAYFSKAATLGGYPFNVRDG